MSYHVCVWAFLRTNLCLVSETKKANLLFVRCLCSLFGRVAVVVIHRYFGSFLMRNIRESWEICEKGEKTAPNHQELCSYFLLLISLNRWMVGRILTAWRGIFLHFAFCWFEKYSWLKKIGLRCLEKHSAYCEKWLYDRSERGNRWDMDRTMAEKTVTF